MTIDVKPELLSVSHPEKISGKLWSSLSDHEDLVLLIKYLFPPDNNGEYGKNYIRKYYTTLEFVPILQEVYKCLKGRGIETMKRNLVSGAHYIAGGYNNSKKRFPNLFEKNLILRYPFVCEGRAPMTTIYAFPYEDGVNLCNRALWEKGYLMKYPPHEPLHRVFVKRLMAGVSERILYVGEKKEGKISHADGEGEWNLDDVLKFRLNGQTEKWFIETLTGSEGYGKFILRRLLTANAYLRENPQDHVIYFLVTVREVQKMAELIRKNNRKKSEKAEQYIRRENQHFVTYRKVETLRKKLGNRKENGKKSVRKRLTNSRVREEAPFFL